VFNRHLISFPELDKLESRTQLPSVADFGKRAGMEFEEDGKPTKDTKVCATFLSKWVALQ